MQLEDQVEVDNLQAGTLQPDFFDEDEDIAATLVKRGGKVWIKEFASGENTLVGLALLDQDPITSHTWPAIAPESFTGRTWIQKVTFDLGGRFLIREVRLRPLADRPDHFLEHFVIGIAD